MYDNFHSFLFQLFNLFLILSIYQVSKLVFLSSPSLLPLSYIIHFFLFFYYCLSFNFYLFSLNIQSVRLSINLLSPFLLPLSIYTLVIYFTYISFCFSLFFLHPTRSPSFTLLPTSCFSKFLPDLYYFVCFLSRKHNKFDFRRASIQAGRKV